MIREYAVDVIKACLVLAALVYATDALAEKKHSTTCDNMCGDSKACQYTCCDITTERVEGVDLITGISCKSSICCAHPQNSTLGSFELPTQPVDGVSAPIKWGFVNTVGLDPSRITVESDDKTKRVTLSGTVSSDAQRRLAETTAKKRAKGYKVINRITVAKYN